MTLIIGKWLIAEEMGQAPGRKTKRWEIRNRYEGCTLGEVYWYSQWKKYVFEPQEASVYESQCLRDLSAFLAKQTDAQRVLAKAEAERRGPAEAAT